MNDLQRKQLVRAQEIAQAIADETTCPDPGEGGCVGGPLRGVGCIHEGATLVARYIRETLEEKR